MPEEPASRRPWKLPAMVALAAVLVLALAVAWWRWPRPTPVVDGTVVVVSPHPDDETYAMGHTLAAQAASGGRIVGVLVTDGEESSYAATWAVEAGEDLDADGDVDRYDFGLARRAEYRSAMVLLGVAEDDLVFLGTSSSHGAIGFADGALDAGALSDALGPIVEDAGARGLLTLARYKGGGPLARLTGDAREHPDHTAAYEAVRSLAGSAGVPATFFKVYVAYQEPWKRLATRYVRGDGDVKRAMAAEYSIGASSTPDLWRYAGSESCEYIGETLRP